MAPADKSIDESDSADNSTMVQVQPKPAIDNKATDPPTHIFNQSRHKNDTISEY